MLSSPPGSPAVGPALAHGQVHGQAEGQARIPERQRRIAATNRLQGASDASRGSAPLAVAEQATLTYKVSAGV